MHCAPYLLGPNPFLTFVIFVYFFCALVLLSLSTYAIIFSVTIKQIQEQSGASIQVPKTGNVDNPAFRTLQITHPDSQGAEYAKQMVLDILKSKPSYAATGNNNNANNGAQQQQQTSIQIAIPDKDVGLCIGRQGCVIKHMQGTTNTRIQIPQQVANPGEQHRIATITGSAQGCQQVQLMIERIVAEQSSASVMSGYPFQQQQPRSHPQQQQYYAPQENQQGYSAEWAAYHAAQAAAAAAQQQQQSLLQQQQEASAAASAAASDYHEQFFRYSFYYGEEAARQYYGAWSPPVGTPNPYGVNPAGITPAPAAAPVAEAAPLQAVAAAVTTALPATANEPSAIAHSAPTAAIDPAEARETSRRHVSNLPAWMTKKD